ncbi:MAG: HAMP domain-containing histidine kinase [Oscillospiraceae bacterium]|nr:HAMP domain-containing histidine kinase [Oscillospiraceae bacterium]
MLNSVYSRIFYLCTIMLMFACALTGVIVLLNANHMHEQEAYDRIDSTARILMTRIKDVYLAEEKFDADQMSSAMETYTLNENVDCYLFDTDGICKARSDYNTTPIALSAVLREEAQNEPYCSMGGASGNFSESTATYVERFALDDNYYYLMLIFPVAYIDEFSAKLLIILLITVLLCSLAGAALFYFNTRQALNPILQITRQAENYAKGDFSARLEETGDPEMDRLILTMNRMADFIDKNERSRRRFVSDVSHELKTPMTTISGFVDGILDGTIPQNQQKQYLRTVSSEVQRLSRLVHSMLSISRFEEGTYSPDFERLDITHLLIKTLLLFEQKVDQKGLTVAGLDACPRTYAEVDHDLMQQVFYNLTENAIKFVNKGGRLFFAVDSDEEQAHVHIRNSGEGLTEDEISHVFERFYKTDESRGRDRTGVGLGLSIVSRIMTLHGGNITVKSVKGEYTEFIVSMPLTQ